VVGDARYGRLYSSCPADARHHVVPDVKRRFRFGKRRRARLPATTLQRLNEQLWVFLARSRVHNTYSKRVSIPSSTSSSNTW